MAINSLMIEWFMTLEERGFFRDKTLLELGPQDIQAQAEKAIKKFISMKFPETKIEIANRILSENIKYMNGTKYLYELFGVIDYYSVDVFDDRADFKVDLNKKFDLSRKFDIITNFGTSEHCSNIANTFEMMDLHLKDNGILLLSLPAFGGLSHGFYNIHPTFYIDFARENHYSIEDFRYIDNITQREAMCGFLKCNTSVFSRLPIRNRNELLTPQISFKIQTVFFKNHLRNFLNQIYFVISHVLKNSIKFVLNVVGRTEFRYTNVYNLYRKRMTVSDYCFVALRKLHRNRNFIYPTQGRYVKNFNQ